MASSNQPPNISVMLAEDHTILRDGLKTIIDVQFSMQVVAEAEDGEEAVELYRTHQPDVLLLDLQLPKRDGCEVIHIIRKEDPNARILVLTTFDGDDDIYRSLRAGALGYLLKDVTRQQLIEAIERVYHRERVLPPSLAAKIAARIGEVELTPRETEILQLIADGQSNKTIADNLHRSEGTVKSHVVSILRKLGANGRTEAINIARKRGLLRR